MFKPLFAGDGEIEDSASQTAWAGVYFAAAVAAAIVCGWCAEAVRRAVTRKVFAVIAELRHHPRYAASAATMMPTEEFLGALLGPLYGEGEQARLSKSDAREFRDELERRCYYGHVKEPARLFRSRFARAFCEVAGQKAARAWGAHSEAFLSSSERIDLIHAAIIRAGGGGCSEEGATLGTYDAAYAAYAEGLRDCLRKTFSGALAERMSGDLLARVRASREKGGADFLTRAIATARRYNHLAPADEIVGLWCFHFCNEVARDLGENELRSP